MGKASSRKAAKRSRGVKERAMNLIEEISGMKKIPIQKNLPQEEKISNALANLLQSEVPEGSPEAAYKVALDFIVTAWNISLLGADQQREAIEEIIAGNKMADAEIRHEMQMHIERMIAGKQAFFPHDRRIVMSWDAWLEGGRIRVSAAALTQSP